DRNVTGVQTCALPICAKRGLQILRELKSNPHRVSMLIPISQREFIVSVSTDTQKLVQFNTNSYTVADRTNNGSFILDAETDGAPISYQLHEIDEPNEISLF